MKTTTVTSRTGRKMTMNAAVYDSLKAAKFDYQADADGLAEAGECLEEGFRDYVDFDEISEANKESKFTIEQQIDKYMDFFSL